MLNAIDVILKKRDGLALSGPEIEFFINFYLRGFIDDCQMSAFLMAVFINGMNDEETLALTDTMLDSGAQISFPEPDDIYVDKHSTGGVGDKVSLILAPLVASCGAKVPMLSGRGLGHTGGTLDKLESIPGFRTDLTIDEIKEGVETIGCVITGQTKNIAPADRKIYALRDVTGTVESIPLICGSILSKKFAAGPRGLVFDVKCGSGAFMKDTDSARNLAQNLVRISRMMKRKASALITDMNQPLGSTVGNLLEVLECIDFLKGTYRDDLGRITKELGARMLILAGLSNNLKLASRLIESKLEDGSAFEKFQEMVAFQNGDLSKFSDPKKCPHAQSIVECRAAQDGYLQRYDTYEIGRQVIELGGGRTSRDQAINPLVGFRFYKKIGDEISEGDPIAEIHAQDDGQAKTVLEKLGELIEIGDSKPVVPELIKEVLD